jgi:imidazolonepropionase-like amidohydrolase
MIRFIQLFLTICLAARVSAQAVPAPGAVQSQPVLITGVTAHLGNGQVLENAAVAFDQGLITYVGPAAAAPEVRGQQRIEARGQHLYPGFIAMNTDLGLVEISAVRATVDNREVGDINSHIRSIIAYNTDSELIPTVRNKGVLLAQVTPQGGRISGSSSAVHLDAWNWEDAALATDEGMHLRWPAQYSYSWRERRSSRNEKYEEQVREIRQFFEQAKAYGGTPQSAARNLSLEALLPLLEGKQRLYIHVDGARSMQEAVLLAKDYSLTPVLVGAGEADQILNFLKAEGVSLVLTETQRLPSRADDALDQPFRLPAILHEAGIPFAITGKGSWQQRNLPFQGGQAVGHGLPYEEAVRAMSLTPATMLGLDGQLGSLEVGKVATMFLSEGDALDMRGNQVRHAFVQGRALNLDDRQKELYRKFQGKYAGE